MFREGVEFITEKNKPSEFPLTYTYPEEVKQVYLHTDKFRVQIETLIKETSLASAKHR